VAAEGWRCLMPSIRIAACARCSVVRLINGRGLCKTCYTWCRRHGALADYERQLRPVDETVAEYRHLHDRCGLLLWQVAERLGLKPDSVRKALYMARKKQRSGG
jgi:hypothetical protein